MTAVRFPRRSLEALGEEGRPLGFVSYRCSSSRYPSLEPRYPPSAPFVSFSLWDALLAAHCVTSRPVWLPPGLFQSGADAEFRSSHYGTGKGNFWVNVKDLKPSWIGSNTKLPTQKQLNVTWGVWGATSDIWGVTPKRPGLDRKQWLRRPGKGFGGMRTHHCLEPWRFKCRDEEVCEKARAPPGFCPFEREGQRVATGLAPPMHVMHVTLLWPFLITVFLSPPPSDLFHESGASGNLKTVSSQG